MKNGKINPDLACKERALENLLREMGGILVAFSGGVDSTFLLYKALRALGEEKVLAVTAASKLYPGEETGSACTLAEQMGVSHLVIQTEELSREEFRRNPPDRCYHCKKELFGLLCSLARERSLPVVVDGANQDDKADYRPGSRAAAECGVRSPLQEAGLTKDEIRRLSRVHGLTTWDKPAAACLASRFPYGEKLDPEKIRQVERGERFLRDLGLRGEIRVRRHDKIARLEILPPEFALVLRNREKITLFFKQIGFFYVSLDLEGFQSGSMNKELHL